MNYSIAVIALLYILSSCAKKEHAVSEQTQPEEVIYYLEAQINNEPFKAEYHSSSGFNVFVGSKNAFSDNQGCLLSYKSGLFKSDNTMPEIHVIFGNFFKQQDSSNCTTDEYYTFESLFIKGEQAYANGSFSKGMMIEFEDKRIDSITYRSDFDRAKDFNFAINDVVFKDCGSNKCAIVQGTFDCIAIDKDNPNNKKEIQLTDGKFKLIFQNKYSQN